MKKIHNKILLSVLALFFSNVLIAQRPPVISTYFQNQYMFNTARVGLHGTKAFDLVYQTPLGQQQQAQRESRLGFMYGFDRHGLGAGVRYNKLGAFNLIEGTASYAFHLPVAEGQLLSLGTGINYLKEQISLQDIVGDVNDPMIAYYNDMGDKLDINIGASYSSSLIDINLAINNILRDKNEFILNQTPFVFSSFSYKLQLEEDVVVSPIVAYRRMLDDRNIYDFGTSVAFIDLFTTYLMYHSSNHYSIGLSAPLGQTFILQCGYSNATSNLRRLGAQGLDIGLRLNF